MAPKKRAAKKTGPTPVEAGVHDDKGAKSFKVSQFQGEPA